MLKKCLSILLVFALCLSLAACGNGSDTQDESAAEESRAQEIGEESEAVSGAEAVQASFDSEPERFETDALTWEFDASNGTLSIHGEGPMRDYSEEAPEWDLYKDQVLSIALDDGITSVGAYAFYDYPAVTEAHLPDSIEVIDTSAFDYDWNLQSITIPASVKYIGGRAFYNTLLQSPQDLVFPEGCTYIGDSAFHSALKTGGIASLPSTLKYLGSNAFTNAVVSDFIVSESNETYCSKNHAIYTKDMKQLLMLAPFAEDVTEFHVPDGVERISSECFNLIHGIREVYIPASVTEIPEGTFFSTFDLIEIIVDEANPNYRSEAGLLLSKDGKVLLAWPDGIQASELMIPGSVERIGAYLFYGRYDGSYSVVISEGVKEIGAMSLPGSMASLSLPSSLEKIDEYVFYDGISIDAVSYNGSAADWENILIGENNPGLDAIAISMN